MTKGDIAYNNFLSGMTCSQSVLCAFLEETGLDRDAAMKISLPFGGGMGRMRLTCGAVTGMIMAFGMIEGTSSVPTQKDKSTAYFAVQKLAELFKEENGSVICSSLLGLSKPEKSHIPDERTDEYYKKRPCPLLCKSAADILENFLKQK
jgi:C_GCAxxG_C_C family probable redox protein